MLHRTVQRSAALVLSGLLTLALLGGIDHLAQPDTQGGGSPQWAQAVSARA